MNPGISKAERFYKNPNARQGLRRSKYCNYCKTIMNLDKKMHHCYMCCICVEGKIPNKFNCLIFRT